MVTAFRISKEKGWKGLLTNHSLQFI